MVGSELSRFVSGETIPEKVLSVIPPIKNIIKFYEFETIKPNSLLSQLKLLKTTHQANSDFLVLDLVEGLLRNHDNLSYYHSIEVGVMTMVMGSLLGLDQERCLRLGLLHDIGKLGVRSDILSLRWIANFNFIQHENGETKAFNYKNSEVESILLRDHGFLGEIILDYLGFDPSYRYIAKNHFKETLTFEDNEPLELMIVTIADWFSAIKDPHRNMGRGTDWFTKETAVKKMKESFEDPRAKVPEEVKQAFLDMINIFNIFPRYNKDEGTDIILQIYELYRTTTIRNSSEDSLPCFYPLSFSLPNFGKLLRKIKISF